MFKKLFWVGAAVLAGLIGYQGFALFQNMNRSSGQVLAPSSPSRIERAADAKRPLSEYQVIVERNPFKAKEPKIQPVKVPAPALKPVQTAPPVNPTAPPKRDIIVPQPKFKLIGTMVRGEEDRSAVIAIDSGEQMVYKLGDQLTPDTKLIKIQKDWVALDKGGANIILNVKLEDEEPARPTAGREMPSPGADVSRPIMAQDRVVSARLPDGKSGLRVFAAKPDGAFAQAGLRVGDVVLKINGKEVRNPTELYQAFQATGQSISLEVIRDNQEMTLSYVAP